MQGIVGVLLLGVVGCLASGYNNVGYGDHGLGHGSSYAYNGNYGGKCGNDGFYYRDGTSFVICSNNNAYVQPCAPGTRNSGQDQYTRGGHYYYRDFCDINLVDYGYGARFGYGGGQGHRTGYGGGHHGGQGSSYGGSHGGYGGSQGGYGGGHSAGGHSGGYGGSHGNSYGGHSGYGGQSYGKGHNEKAYGKEYGYEKGYNNKGQQYGHQTGHYGAGSHGASHH